MEDEETNSARKYDDEPSNGHKLVDFPRLHHSPKSSLVLTVEHLQVHSQRRQDPSVRRAYEQSEKQTADAQYQVLSSEKGPPVE